MRINFGALDVALKYATQRGKPVFPCQWQGVRRKQPLTNHGYFNASRAPETIVDWWRRWPEALIGLPTGQATGLVVLDIDIKDDRTNGFDALDDLGHSILPNTWLARTPGGGSHVYFDPREHNIRCSASKLGRGLDIRACGGYVIAPSPDSGYAWDAHWNPETTVLMPVPDWLILPRPEPAHPAVEPADGLSPYARAALDSACRNIATAPAGVQEKTLASEAFSIGRLAGAGAIPPDFARSALVYAGTQMISHDPRRQWIVSQITAKVERSFHNGVGRPRGRSDV